MKSVIGKQFIFMAGGLSEGYEAYGPYADFNEVCHVHDGEDGAIVEIKMDSNEPTDDDYIYLAGDLDTGLIAYGPYPSIDEAFDLHENDYGWALPIKRKETQ